MNQQQELSKSELQKYFLTFERYRNHQKARALAFKQYLDNAIKIELLRDYKGFKESELVFLKECRNVIMTCRQVLSWTFAAMFYDDFQFKKGEKELFEFQHS